MSAKTLFDTFTNLYPLAKTLRFELEPFEETKPFLNEVIAKDTEIEKLYEAVMKPCLDKIHSEFITDSLKNTQLNESYIHQLKELIVKKRSFKNRQEQSDVDEKIEDVVSKLREDVATSYTYTAEKWKEANTDIPFKEKGYKTLTEAASLKLLIKKFPEKEKEIKKFEMFWTYFTGYNQNRENYYGHEDKSTAVSYRVINDNLFRFIDNCILYASLHEKNSKYMQYAEVFELSTYTKTLSQSTINVYNVKIGELNKLSNELYPGKERKKQKIPMLKVLYKEIGSEIQKEKARLVIEKGKEWEYMRAMIDAQMYSAKAIELLTFIVNTLADPETDISAIHINQRAIHTLSAKWFTSWEDLGRLLKEKGSINQDKKTGEFRMPKQISLHHIREALVLSNTSVIRQKYVENKIVSKDADGWANFIAIFTHELSELTAQIQEAVELFQKISKTHYKKNLHTKDIKFIADAFLAADRVVKYFVLKDTSVATDGDFYQKIDEYNTGSQCQKYYDAFRNYVTQKPSNENKIKLNFANGQLLDGWDQNKEDQYYGVLLAINDLPHLAIMRKGNTKFFDESHTELYTKGQNMIEKYIYKLLPGPNKMLPKVAFAKSNRQQFTHIFAKYPAIEEVRENETFKKQEKKDDNGKKIKYVDKEGLSLWINFMREILKTYPDWKQFEFEKHLRPTHTYVDVSDFYRDVATYGYKLEKIKINKNVLDRGVQDGEIYLFQIVNKDFKHGENGTKENLHTLLFKELLKPENSRYLKLSGGAEIFFRKAIPDLEKKDIITKEKNKNITSVLPDVVAYRRYTTDKYFLHFPIEVRGGELQGKFNDKVNAYITENRDKINVIGIDRGEKHLLYYSVVLPTGEIIEQGSLNTIHNQNYEEKLRERQDKRNKAREEWEEIGNIKNFKEGYISQAVHEIYQIMLRHNACVVIEDLNIGFRSKRLAKVEKSIYTKFEVALAKKLNHLILKERASEIAGGVLHPYQLTPLISSSTLQTYEKSKQWGMLFKVNPAYTSTTDPVSRWYKHAPLYISPYDTLANIKKKFNAIQITRHDGFYRFTYEYHGKVWHLDAKKNIERYYFDTQSRIRKQKDFYNDLSFLLDGYNKSNNVSAQLFEVEVFDWKQLAYCLKYLTQIRNTDLEGQDFIQSPVAPYFDSRIGFKRVIDETAEKLQGEQLPVSGDGNGAYHIGVKGQMLIDRIAQNYGEVDLFISDEDWSGR